MTGTLYCKIRSTAGRGQQASRLPVSFPYTHCSEHHIPTRAADLDSCTWSSDLENIPPAFRRSKELPSPDPDTPPAQETRARGLPPPRPWDSELKTTGGYLFRSSAPCIGSKSAQGS